MPRRRGIGLDFVDALPSDGERRLMLAVLIDAVRLTRSLQVEEAKTGHLSFIKRRQLMREYNWFRSPERGRPFAFQTICEALGLDADYVRRCVLHPSHTQTAALPVRRYAARVEESWLRQRKHGGQIVLLHRRRRRSRKSSVAGRLGDAEGGLEMAAF